MNQVNQATSGPTAGRLARRKAKTRAAILGAAGDLFRDHGFEETSIQQIAEAADTGTGTVYGYFSSKEEILRAVLESHAEEGRLRYLAAVTEQHNSLDRVLLAIQMLSTYAELNRRILVAAFASASRPSRIDADAGSWIFDGFCAIIRDGVNRGELRAVPVEVTARMLVSGELLSVLGIGVWAGAEDNASTRADIETFARMVLEPAA